MTSSASPPPPPAADGAPPSAALVVVGVDRTIIGINQGLESLTGRLEGDVLGRPWTALLDDRTDPSTVDRVERALAGPRDGHIDVFLLHEDGDRVPAALTILPMSQAGVDGIAFIGVLRATGNFVARRVVRRISDRRNWPLVENIPAGVVVHDVDSAVLMTNHAATLLLRRDREEMTGMRTDDHRWGFIREDGSPMARSEYPAQRVLDTRQVVRNLVLGIPSQAGGEPVWVMCNGFPLADESGRTVEVVVTFTDVSRLKETERALAKSEERLRLIMQSTNDALWDYHIDTNAIYYSPRWWEMLGMEPDESIREPDWWLGLMHPDDRLVVVPRVRQAMEGNDTTIDIEFRLRHTSGRYIPILSRAIILRGPDGRAVRVAGTNADLTERKHSEDRIHRLAYYDALTELPNRRLLMEQLHDALASHARSGRFGALLFIDLDNFKVLNDTAGHEVGDQLLRQVANRLVELVDECDIVARLGGDEFVVLLQDIGDDRESSGRVAADVAERILSALGVSYLLAGKQHRSTPSIGVALFQDASTGVETVLKQADLAMYKAKAMGRNTVRFFDVGMQDSVDERLALENDLRDALWRHELVLHYQPQVDATGRVIGAEALVRWQHPVRGLVMPNVFIPLAEATSLIVPLGEWVMREACLRLAAWRQDERLGELSLSVNVSVQQIRERTIVSDALHIIDQTGADPARLKFELTESLLAEDIQDTIAKMGALKAHGISFSLDDFGTGYSSLSYLKRMPLDQLKIDRSFVDEVLTNTNDETIAKIIITLGERLNLDVIAEGVETQGQWRFLADNGCRSFQGYLFGRPEPAADFERKVRAGD